MSLTLIADLNGSGAYPTIARQLSRALQKQGVCVLENWHGDADELTPVALTCQYPPVVPNIKHPLNAAWVVWEFLGGAGVPRSFVEVFDRLDLVITATEWGAAQFREVTKTPVKVVPFGFDPDEFNLRGEIASWGALFPGESWAADPTIIKLLWIGGTDARHGLDIAEKVTAKLPDQYHLIAKTSVHYPPGKTQHPRVHVLRQDFPSLAPLYRACDLYLHTARAVGFSLPVLEALVCGKKVVSTPLPAVQEFAIRGVVYSEGGSWEWYHDHPVHQDCRPRWFEPGVEGLVEVIRLLKYVDPSPNWPGDLQYYRQHYTWDVIAKHMREVLGLG